MNHSLEGILGGRLNATDSNPKGEYVRLMKGVDVSKEEEVNRDHLVYYEGERMLRIDSPEQLIWKTLRGGVPLGFSSEWRIILNNI